MSISAIQPPTVHDPAFRDLTVALDPPAHLPDRPLAAPNVLEQVRLQLQAAYVALVRLSSADLSFVVLQSAPVAFLAPGVRLSSETWTLLRDATPHDQRDTRQAEGSPLDHLLLSLGLSSAASFPLVHDDPYPARLIVAWSTDEARPVDPPAVVVRHRHSLEAALDNVRHRGRTVLVCHEDQLIAGGLARAIEHEVGADGVLSCSIETALDCLRARSPDLVVCSDHLSADLPIHEVARKLRAAGSAAPLLVVARTGGPYGLERALAAGASGYLSLPLAPEKLSDTASALFEGRSMLPQLQTTAPEAPRLTRREVDVLVGLDRGLSDKQIAFELSVAISTVKTHARALYGKLDARSRSAAVHEARRLGLI